MKLITWLKGYQNYPINFPLILSYVESGREIIGCEMHELNG
jgi:hypothetical protein